MVIELRHLRHLLALAEHGNFGRAAEALHLTQPALTRSIQALEALVDAPLFERYRSGIEPTEMGRLLLRHARGLHASSHDLMREIGLAKGLELGELRIGVGPFGGSALIGTVVGRLNRLHPHLRIQLVVAPWQELPERARARDVDLVVGELSELAQLEDFEHSALAEHRSMVVCRAAHPLLQLAAPSAASLFAYPLAGPRLPPLVAQAVLAAAPAGMREGLGRRGLLTIECDSSTVLKNIMMESDAVSNMPRFMVDAELRAGQLALLPAIDLGLRVRFGTAWLRHRALVGAALKFVELLRGHDAALTRQTAQTAQTAQTTQTAQSTRRKRAGAV